MAESRVLLDMESITKEFPGVRALDQVTMSVRRGEGSTVAAARPCPGWRSAVAQPD